jgi:hypothetical protein
MLDTPGPRLDLQFPSEADTDAIEFVAVPPEGDAPQELADQVLLHVPHDGNILPREYLEGHDGPVALESFARDYVAERDWGASRVAERLAARLGLGGYWRIRVARVLMDFGRFPGETRADRGHLHRFALNYPFSSWLSRARKRRVLEALYDRCSDVLEPAVVGKTILIGIHTYDPRNDSGTLRPDVSLITRPAGYQAESRMPIGVFDAMYPDLLAEYTADRILHDRISLTLEKARIRVGHNHPYLLPEGSIEVRSQVFFFFDFVRREFLDRRPETETDPSFQLVWQMLLDTNLRSVESEALRSHLHMYRQAPRQRQGIFKAAVDAYEQIHEFVQGSGVIERYRFSPQRPSSLALEVRKDLVWRFDRDGWPDGPVEGEVDRIAERVAAALVTYHTQDRGVWD